MRYWWVNHKQTFRQEFGGNYIWSPKTKRDGSFNRFYETMRDVAPGDVVFSYAGGLIRGFGVAQTHCYTSPRPDEFGHIGEVWDRLGWRVDVSFAHTTPTIRPSDHMQTLDPVLPNDYKLLTPTGQGYQHIYLAPISKKMALVLGQLIGPTLLRIVQDTRISEEPKVVDTELRGINEWEEAETNRILQSKTLAETTRHALIKARVG